MSILARVPLGEAAGQRYGAPYWAIHRADLQGVLAAAVSESVDVTVRLGTRVEDLAIHKHGVTVQARNAGGVHDEQGLALVGADGLWSTLRAAARRSTSRRPSRGARAWRAIVPGRTGLTAEFRAPETSLWLGRDAHLVHYPVKAGREINIRRDRARRLARRRAGASPASPPISCPVTRASRPPPRALLALPQRWQKWALFDRPSGLPRREGPVTLIGDAAHPMLPFLAQGGAMAIEDAARCSLRAWRGDESPADAMRAFEAHAARAWRGSRARPAATLAPITPARSRSPATRCCA